MAAAVRVQFGGALGRRRGAIPDRPALRRLLERAARAVLRHERIERGELSITLLDDDDITLLHSEYLGRDDVTDVISFALFEEGEDPVGDVYIGYDQALRQAEESSVSAPAELARLVVHGVLHVLGHDHPAGQRRIRSAMWRRQETILASVLDA